LFMTRGCSSIVGLCSVLRFEHLLSNDEAGPDETSSRTNIKKASTSEEDAA
jgi:hypothetical protein